MTGPPRCGVRWAMPATPAAPAVKLAFDVQDLDRACEFYGRVLGFCVISTQRAGQIFEQRSLVSSRCPAVQLDLRQGFGKRTVGMSPGGVTKLSIRVPNVAEALSAISGPVRWVGPAPDPHSPPPVLTFIDPDAYQVELFA